MKDGGVIPKDKLDVKRVETPEGTTLTLKSPTEPKETPVWESITLTPGDLKKVTVTPVGKNGKPVGKSTTTPVKDSKKPTEVTFKKPLEADQLVVLLTPTTPKKPTDVDVVSVVSCMPEEGEITT